MRKLTVAFRLSGFVVATITGILIWGQNAQSQNNPQLPLPVNVVSPSPLPVTVSGEVTGTLNTNNPSEPGRQPYVASMGFSQFGCFTLQCTNFVKSGGAVLFDGPEVPAGKRLVIQYVSGRVPQADSVDVSVALQTQQVLSQFSVIWSFFGPFFTQSSLQGFSSPAFATYGPGERPHVHLIIPSPNNFVGLVNLSGYLINAE